MTKVSITLQDLRRKIYIKAKSEKAWRFWGLYVHVCKRETLKESYRLAKRNKGSAGIDGMTFEDIEASGVDIFLEDIQQSLISKTYSPNKNRQVAIPKGNGDHRTLQIPTIRDRVIEGALKLILEPVFEADFQPGSYGYRPKRTAQEAVDRMSQAAMVGMTRVISVDLHKYFDSIRRDRLLNKVAERINDKDILWLLKRILKKGGKRGISQGGPLSPLLSNLYLNDVDKALEEEKRLAEKGGYVSLAYVRWADDLIILIRSGSGWDWFERRVTQRLRKELDKIHVTLNEQKTRIIDFKKGETVTFLGFDFRRFKTRRGKWSLMRYPCSKARKSLLQKLKEVFKRFVSQPVDRVIYLINPILRGWANYFRTGNATHCFKYVKNWVEKKVRRHLMRSRKRGGFGWKRWSTYWIYKTFGLYRDYQVRYPSFAKVYSS